MITIDMTRKIEKKITNRHFSVENGILTLKVNLGDYALVDKQITAAFGPAGVETAPLAFAVVEGNNIVDIPIYSTYIKNGVNYIQLYFRWDTSKVENSSVMTWRIDNSILATAPGTEEQDLMSFYLQEIQEAILEADRVVDEAGDVRVALDESTGNAQAINDTLADPVTGTIKQATDANTELEGTIVDAETAKSNLDDPVTGAIVLAEAAEDDLTNPTTGAIKQAEDAKGEIEQAIIDNEIVTLTEFDAHKAESVTLGKSVVLGDEEFKLVQIISTNDYGITVDVGDGILIGFMISNKIIKLDYELNPVWEYFTSVFEARPFGYDSNGNIYIPTTTGIEIISSGGVYQTTIESGNSISAVAVDRVNNNLYYGVGSNFKKTDLSGNLVWEDTTRDDSVRDVIILPSGRVATARYSTTNSTICYNADGSQYWLSNSPYRVVSLESDEFSNVFAGGSSNHIAKLKNTTGVKIWENTNISSYLLSSQISKDNNGDILVPHFTTDDGSYFALLDGGSGKLKAKSSFGVRHSCIKYINRNLIIVSRLTSSGGDYSMASYRLKREVLGVD